MVRTKSALQRTTAVAIAVGLALLLSGCVIVPAGPYYHPHRAWYY